MQFGYSITAHNRSWKTDNGRGQTSVISYVIPAFALALALIPDRGGFAIKFPDISRL